MHENTTTKQIDLSEFSLMLQGLEKTRKDIFIRVQLIGEEWMEHFSNVLVFTPHAIILNHVPTRTIRYIRNINDVAAFEMNHPYSILNAFKRYYISRYSKGLKIKQGEISYG